MLVNFNDFNGIGQLKQCYRNWKKEQEEMNSQSIPVTCGTTTSYVDMWTLPVATCPSYSSLGTCEAATPQKLFWGVKQEEGNNPMNYATATVQAATTETQDQRKYLERRLQDVYSQKRDGLEAAFGLVDDDAPNGPGELSERLKEGKFTIRGLDKDKGAQFNYWVWFDLIQWRDPSRKEDAEGFKKAVDELKALRQKSLDSIKIEDVKAGLDAVKALEAWEPAGAAN